MGVALPRDADVAFEVVSAFSCKKEKRIRWTDRLLSVSIFLEHHQNLRLLKALPPNTIDWSMLCPNIMVPETPAISLPGSTPKETLEASAETLPR
jgi:hypothetical protein